MTEIIDQWGLLDPARAAREVNASSGGSSGPTIIEVTTGASPLVIDPDPANTHTIYHVTTGGTAGTETIQINKYTRDDPGGGNTRLAANGNTIAFSVISQSDGSDAVHVQLASEEIYIAGPYGQVFGKIAGGSAGFVLLDYQGASTEFEWVESRWQWDGRAQNWDNSSGSGSDAGNIVAPFTLNGAEVKVVAPAGGIIHLLGSSATATDAGVPINITAGQSDHADVSAGAVNISAGPTSGAATNAAALSLQAGYATGAGSVGGDLNISAGQGGTDAPGGNIQIQAGGGQGAGGQGGNLTLYAGAGDSGAAVGQILLPNLPTSDPHVVGALWNSTGTLKISAG